MLVDSHCHLDYPPLYENLEEVVLRAKNVGVKYFLTISTTINSFEKIKIIVEKYNEIYGTIGIHPHEADQNDQIDKNLLLGFFKGNKKIIGVGETGLDYFYNNSDKKNQKRIFEEHIYAAIELNKPIIIHSRNAENDTYDMLKQNSNFKNLKILMHCFTGSENFAKKLLDIGAYISFSGIVTFNNSKDLANTAKTVPLDRLLLETDSPYLSPVPKRGKPNEPSFIKHTAEKMSDIKKIDIENLSNATTNNFLKLFSLNLK